MSKGFEVLTKNFFFKLVGEFFLIFLPISMIFTGIALVRLFGIQDIGNVAATINLGGLFSVNHLFLSAFFKFFILCPAVLTSLMMLIKYVKIFWYKVILYFVLIIAVSVISIKIFIGNVYISLSSEWSDLFKTSYIKPSPEDFNLVGSAQNIIWIYSESTEKNYKNSNILRNLLSTTSFMHDINLSPIINGYTMGAIASSRCGAPLFTGAISQNFNPRTPFANSQCFDGILRSHGYSSEFLVGHDAEFSGIKPFFEHHADAMIFDSEQLNRLKSLDRETFNDQDVLDFAFDRILKLHQTKKLFNVTILTFDNHAPVGFPSDICLKTYGANIDNVIQCNSDILADFINKIKLAGVLKNTVLVVLGDHPFMGKFPSLSEDRMVFSKIYTPLNIKLKIDKFTPFDLAPTVLESMGFKLNKERFGLGSSAYSEDILNRDTKWSDMLSEAFTGPPPNYYIDLHVRK